MKRIGLLSLPDPRFPLDDPGYEANRVDYRSIIEQAVRIPLDRQAGASIDEMRKGIRILDALDACDTRKEPIELGYANVLELEDADWEFLKTKVEKFPWAGTDRRFLRFYDDVMGATDAPRVPALSDGLAS